MAKSSTQSPVKTEQYPVITLRDTVVFPFWKVSFKIGRPVSLKALETAMVGNRQVFLVTQRDPSVENPTSQQIYTVGTISKILLAEKSDENQYKIIVEGCERARIIQIKKHKGAFSAKVQPVPPKADQGKDITRLRQRIGVLLGQYLPVMLAGTGENIKRALHKSDPSVMADGIAAWLPLVSYEDKQELLETFPIRERLQQLVSLLEAKGVEQHEHEEELEHSPTLPTESAIQRTLVFIGHGRSLLWARVKVFLEDELGLKTVTYESESRAGQSIVPVLEKMLNEASFAVLILTAEDETATGSKRARQNVIHEAGLFQGRLGFEKAIMLVQEGLEDFSNVAGLQNILFTGERIDQTFYELQKVLRREGLIQ